MYASGAPIVLVGTHKDVVPEETTQHELSKIIVTHFQNTSRNAFEYIEQCTEKLCYFPVNNTCSGTDVEDQTIVELRGVMERRIRADVAKQSK